MSAIGQFMAGIGTQANRNVVLEPWGENTRSESGARRNGEIAADAVFIAGGGTMVAQTGRLLARKPAGLGLTGAAISAGIAVYGAIGAVVAATGVKNLFAKLPATSPPSEPKPPSTDRPPAQGPSGPSGPGQEPAKGGGAFHTVRPGETLNFIADCNDVAWRDLYTYNRDVIGNDPDELEVGMRLAIPPEDYVGGDFAYVPSRPPGQLPAGLECIPAEGVHGPDC